VDSFGLTDLLRKVTVIEPVGYRTFLGLAAECAFLVSDSGGVQEEATVVKRPVLVVRNSTERPECLGVFARLVQPGPVIRQIAGGWAEGLADLHDSLANLTSPYGDGSASRRCLSALIRLKGAR
jgi:UDP-N-acetylglucosamine 2-epimerase (non-hydrolysing)